MILMSWNILKNGMSMNIRLINEIVHKSIVIITIVCLFNKNHKSFSNMKISYANIRSLNTSFNLVETACNRQNIKILGLSEIWHPDNALKDTVKQK